MPTLSHLFWSPVFNEIGDLVMELLYLCTMCITFMVIVILIKQIERKHFKMKTQKTKISQQNLQKNAI